jgi:hypothetical protein
MKKEDFIRDGASQRPKVRIGDRVRFLNDVGGGIVTAFHGRDQVLVEDENGFDVPVLIGECVVIEETVGRADRDGAKAPAASSVLVARGRTDGPDGQPIVSRERGGASRQDGGQDERLNVSIAFLPADRERFMQSDFEAYFVNDSGYSLYFNWMCRGSNGWVSRSHGLVEPDTKIFIETVRRQDVKDLARVCVQMLAFKGDGCFALKDPVSVEVRTDPATFCKRKSFTGNDYFDEDAMILSLVREDVAVRYIYVSKADVREVFCVRRKEEESTATATKKQSTPLNEVIEVDLHINQLIETTAGMDHAAILDYQISHFHKVMQAHLGEKGRKIVFIHGKGEGVLRTALEQELKTVYRHQSRFQDASFSQYGFGATMVIIESRKS